MAFRSQPLRLLTRSIRTQAQYDYAPKPNYNEYIHAGSEGLATPRQLVQYLDEYVVGQKNAKKVLSVAVFNHYNRVRANFRALESAEAYHGHWGEEEEDSQSGILSAHVQPHPQRVPPTSAIPVQPHFAAPLLEKSNVLVIGPTGSGKTLLARTLANVLDVPFSVSDATSFTQAGYIGEDVDVCIQRLLQSANWDPHRASMGIVYIDEVDKIARKAGSGGLEGSRDVAGEGVQQALLRILEGSVVTVPAKGAAVEGPGVASSEGRSRSTTRTIPPSPAKAAKPDMFQIDTSNVLFILSGAFVGLETIIKRRVAKGSIGFGATLNAPSEDTTPGFMPFFTSNRRVSPNLFELVEPADLIQYGFIPEFISRLPSLTTLSPLTPTDLRRILTEVRGSLISQYSALFGYSGVEIRFTTGALNAICQKAAERGGGARGLRGIMETLLLEPMYEVPGSNVRHVLINEAVVQGKSSALYWSEGDGAGFWAAWAGEESATGKAAA